MIRKLFSTAISLLIATTLFAQNDTLYIMKDGQIAAKYNLLTEIDSIVFYNPNAIDLPENTFIDNRDGTIYSFVTIGEQVWMRENLKYLPEVIDPSASSFIDPFFYVYDYHGTNTEAAKATESYQTYGVLYNWPAAMNGQESSDDNPSGVQGVCPTGWHLPSDAEWTQLTDFLGGIEVAGGKLKEEGTAHWLAPNSGATNESGFTALPAGFHFIEEFMNMGESADWWSSSYDDEHAAWIRSLHFLANNVSRSADYTLLGFSVRCIKD